MTELNGLIGFVSVKQEQETLHNLIKTQKMRAEKGLPNAIMSSWYLRAIRPQVRQLLASYQVSIKNAY